MIKKSIRLHLSLKAETDLKKSLSPELRLAGLLMELLTVCSASYCCRSAEESLPFLLLWFGGRSLRRVGRGGTRLQRINRSGQCQSNVFTHQVGSELVNNYPDADFLSYPLCRGPVGHLGSAGVRLLIVAAWRVAARLAADRFTWSDVQRFVVVTGGKHLTQTVQEAFLNQVIVSESPSGRKRFIYLPRAAESQRRPTKQSISPQ